MERLAATHTLTMVGLRFENGPLHVIQKHRRWTSLRKISEAATSVGFHRFELHFLRQR